ncbi:MAG: hemerythrin domain-containing protein [Bryobacterales bacterium]|nr:hemerythrin domain-containing protein [Bryobacterales bacterium]
MIRTEDLFAPKRDTLSHPLEHLTACHRRIEQRLELLVKAGEVFEMNPTAAREAIQSACAFMERSGVQHTEDEEQSLFPRLAPHLEAGEAEFVGALEAEHKVADAAYARLQQAIAGLPESLAEYCEAAKSLREIYQRHIAVEDDKLMALGGRVLSPGELYAISREMRARRGLGPAE